MDDIENKIKKLARIKDQTGLSQEKIAREMGVAIQTSHNWLTGKTRPKSELQISALDRFIGKYSDYLKK